MHTFYMFIEHLKYINDRMGKSHSHINIILNVQTSIIESLPMIWTTYINAGLFTIWKEVFSRSASVITGGIHQQMPISARGCHGDDNTFIRVRHSWGPYHIFNSPFSTRYDLVYSWLLSLSFLLLILKTVWKTSSSFNSDIDIYHRNMNFYCIQ